MTPRQLARLQDYVSIFCRCVGSAAGALFLFYVIAGQAVLSTGEVVLR